MNSRMLAAAMAVTCAPSPALLLAGPGAFGLAARGRRG